MLRMPMQTRDACSRAIFMPDRIRPQPQPQPAASSSSSSGVDAENDAVSLSAGRLHRHALQSIFAFLQWGELAAVLRVSQEWLGAMRTMRRMRLCLVRPAVPLRLVAASAMGRHVFTLGSMYESIALDGNDLFILADKMAHLRWLSCRLAPPPAHLCVTFPPALVELTLQIPVQAAGSLATADINAVIQSAGRLTQLEKLTLHLPAWDAQLSFAPLSGTVLPKLAELEIRLDTWGAPVNISNAQIDELRAMRQLRQLLLDRDSMDFELLSRLLRQPHALQWQQISLPSITDEAVALLVQLPSLTHLSVQVECARFEWLPAPQLSNLRHVCLVRVFHRLVDIEADIDPLVAALQHCTQIDLLDLTGFVELTAAHLADLLPHLTKLKSLVLESLRIDSLAFLMQEPIQNQLLSLNLEECRQLPLEELMCLHSLRALRTLRLVQSFDGELDRFSQRILTPPSLFLPQLKSFYYDYEQPVEHEPADQEDQPEDDQ